jgi:hypothetical protein
MSPPRETWITKLIAAELAEAKALDGVRKTRSRVAKLIDQAVSDGVSHHEIARGLLRHRLGHAPSIDERLREVERLRKRRRRGTARPAEDRGVGLKRTNSDVGCSSEVKTMAERLIRRKTETIEEEFVKEPEEKDDDDCDEDTKAAAGADDEEEEEEEDEDEGDEE